MKQETHDDRLTRFRSKFVGRDSTPREPIDSDSGNASLASFLGALNGENLDEATREARRTFLSQFKLEL